MHLSWKVMKLSWPGSSWQLNFTSLWMGQSLCGRASALLGKTRRNNSANFIIFSTVYLEVIFHGGTYFKLNFWHRTSFSIFLNCSSFIQVSFKVKKSWRQDFALISHWNDFCLIPLRKQVSWRRVKDRYRN